MCVLVAPWIEGGRPVSIDMWVGSVHDEVLTAVSKTTPSSANASMLGAVFREVSVYR